MRRSQRRAAAAVLALAGAGVAAWLWLRPPATAPGVSIRERAAQTLQHETHSLAARVIANDDLPPEGTRSLFDHLIAQNDSLPYPFEKLVDLLRRQGPASQPPLTVMIPFGRSLLKARADFAHPRVVVAADYAAPDTPASLGVRGRGQLFLGFVENAHEIEIISYNEAAGRYEFQLVQDYAENGRRRIVYARRAVCMTCHQNGSPIFPQRPWNETNAQPEIAEHIVAARGSGDYLGVPPQTALGSPERIDELTDVGSFLVATQHVWLDGCARVAAAGGSGDAAALAKRERRRTRDGSVEVFDIEDEGGQADAGTTPAEANPPQAASCRRLLLKLGLRYAWDPGRFDANGADAMRLRRLQSAAWPNAGIAVPESDLRNRDPLAQQRGWKGFLRSLFVPAPEPGAGAQTNADLDAFDKLPPLPPELDPLTPRPPKRVLTAKDIDGVYGIAAQFGVTDIERLAAAAGQDWTRVDAAVDALPYAFFGPRPFSRVRSLQALLATAPLAGAGSAVPDYCCLDVSEMSAPIAAGAPPLKLADGSPLQPFAEYCFACHRGNPNARLDFMGGADEAEVAARIHDKHEIRDALDWERYAGTDKASKLMPPADSPQRARLEAAVEKDPQLLEQMRSQVAGLFDF